MRIEQRLEGTLHLCVNPVNLLVRWVGVLVHRDGAAKEEGYVGAERNRQHEAAPIQKKRGLRLARQPFEHTKRVKPAVKALRVTHGIGGYKRTAVADAKLGERFPTFEIERLVLARAFEDACNAVADHTHAVALVERCRQAFSRHINRAPAVQIPKHGNARQNARGAATELAKDERVDARDAEDASERHHAVWSGGAHPGGRCLCLVVSVAAPHDSV